MSETECEQTRSLDVYGRRRPVERGKAGNGSFQIKNSHWRKPDRLGTCDRGTPDRGHTNKEYTRGEAGQVI